MQKTKQYKSVVFSASAIEAGLAEFSNVVEDTDATKFSELTITRTSETWDYDNFEEFLADYKLDFLSADVSVRNGDKYLGIRMNRRSPILISSQIRVGAADRAIIQRLGNVFDRFEADCRIAEPPSPLINPKIFIGHGQSKLWRDLKDHLADHHGYKVLAYESGARAGHAIRDVIEDLLDQSSFAILVMTGDDEMPDGSFRARQNVVHEIGLFQGRLGFTKAIVLKEEGVEEFSNIHGVHQIRFARGNIKETFGEVLATLRREFETQSAR
jgi:predicted nucleotide-binding protein